MGVGVGRHESMTAATFGPKLFQSSRHLEQFIKVVINDRHWFQYFTIDESKKRIPCICLSVVDP